MEETAQFRLLPAGEDLHIDSHHLADGLYNLLGIANIPQRGCGKHMQRTDMKLLQKHLKIGQDGAGPPDPLVG